MKRQFLILKMLTLQKLLTEFLCTVEIFSKLSISWGCLFKKRGGATEIPRIIHMKERAPSSNNYSHKVSAVAPTLMNGALISFLSSFLYLSVLLLLLFFAFLLCFLSLFSFPFLSTSFFVLSCSLSSLWFTKQRQSFSSSRRLWMPLCFCSYLSFVSFCPSSPSLSVFLLCFSSLFSSVFPLYLFLWCVLITFSVVVPRRLYFPALQ